jgi:transcriptional regulator with XRE-family HTH domain
MITIWDCEPEDLSLAVRFLRALRGWTQTELADKARWSKSRISLLEAGKEVPDEDDLKHLAAVVGLQLHLLDSCLPLLRLLRLNLGREARRRHETEEHVAHKADDIASSVAATTRITMTTALLKLERLWEKEEESR